MKYILRPSPCHRINFHVCHIVIQVSEPVRERPAFQKLFCVKWQSPNPVLVPVLLRGIRHFRRGLSRAHSSGIRLDQRGGHRVPLQVRKGHKPGRRPGRGVQVQGPRGEDGQGQRVHHHQRGEHGGAAFQEVLHMWCSLCSGCRIQQILHCHEYTQLWE